MIIEELRAIQRKHGSLPSDELHALSQLAHVPLYHLHGLAAFYPHFRPTPPSPVEVRICLAMSCHLQGADDLARAVEARVAPLGPSGAVIREVSCLGQCDRGVRLLLADDRAAGARLETYVTTHARMLEDRQRVVSEHVTIEAGGTATRRLP